MVAALKSKKKQLPIEMQDLLHFALTQEIYHVSNNFEEYNSLKISLKVSMLYLKVYPSNSDDINLL